MDKDKENLIQDVNFEEVKPDGDSEIDYLESKLRDSGLDKKIVDSKSITNPFEDYISQKETKAPIDSHQNANEEKVEDIQKSNPNNINTNAVIARGAVSVVDEVLALVLGQIAEESSEYFLLEDKDKELLILCFDELFKDSNIVISPGVQLLIVIATVYGSPVSKALQIRSEKKKLKSGGSNVKSEIAEEMKEEAKQKAQRSKGGRKSGVKSAII